MPPGISPELPAKTLPCLGEPGSIPLRNPGNGRPALVNVWATWCRPCVTEVPTLVRLARDASGRLDLIGILTQDTPRNGLEFARQTSMRYPSLIDDDGVVMRRFSPGPPVTLFLDSQGRIRHVQRGVIKDDRTLRQLVREHLGLDIPARDPATTGGGTQP